MKEISWVKKQKVIKLFFIGLSYDEIAQQLGLAKGSVVNIIEEFKQGSLSIPVNMKEYMDELRHLVVDMKKHNTTVNQLKSYSGLHIKLKEMGVGTEQVDQWLDISQDIATESVSAKKFVAAALHLTKLENETGRNPESLVAEFESQTEALNTLKVETVEALGLKEKAVAELGSVTKAIASAKEAFSKQKQDLKEQLNKHLIQHKFSWAKVDAVIAILHGELGNAGLSEDEIGKISKQIANVGSLTVYIGELEDSQKALEDNIQQLGEENHTLELTNIGSSNMFHKLVIEVLAKLKERKKVDSQLETKKSELAKLQDIVAAYARDIYTARLVLAFLISKDLISDYDFDEIVKLMLGIRQFRLGIGPKIATDDKGKVVCACQVPAFSIPTGQYETSMEEAKQRLALCLVSLVQSKFVPKFEYEAAKLIQEITEMNEQLTDALSGHPGVPDKSADQPGPSEQKTAKTAAGEANTVEQSDEGTPGQTDIPEHLGFLQFSPACESAETIKAEMDANKKFLASLGKRINKPSPGKAFW